MVLFTLSPTMTELVPVFGALFAIVVLGGLALYTRHQARRPEK